MFSICSYWIFGFDNKAGKFFVFWFSLMMVTLTMVELFRICGNLASSYFAANQLSNVVLVVLLGYTGYLIPYAEMHGWVCAEIHLFNL
jgi:ATP-binding cassette, subfamily G (WHITE), member 2, SNQ2